MGNADDPGIRAAAAPDPGLCRSCRHARLQPSATGSAFWRCLRSDQDPAYLRYPPLPVHRCAGFEVCHTGEDSL